MRLPAIDVFNTIPKVVNRLRHVWANRRHKLPGFKAVSHKV